MERQHRGRDNQRCGGFVLVLGPCRPLLPAEAGAVSPLAGLQLPSVFVICGFKPFLLIREIRYYCWKWLVGFSSVVIQFYSKVKGDSLISWSKELVLWKGLLSSLLCYETN